jgi:hypothetical protein
METTIIGSCVAAIASVAGIIYGYRRWRYFKKKDELLWCVYGTAVLAVIAWIFLSHAMFTDSTIVVWSRRIMLVLAGVVGVGMVIWSQNKPY